MRFEEFKKLKELEKFAEGYRGVIYTYAENGKKFAVKVPSEEKLVKTFQKEAKILQFLNQKGVKFVPQLTFIGDDFFVYQFLEGEPFKKLQKKLEKEKLLYYLRKILIAAYCLDRLGVFKDEFQRPFTNILINGRKVYLLDFERGLLNKPWKNVPQFLQFLVALKVLNKEEAIRLGREYKKYPKEVVKKLLKRLKSFQKKLEKEKLLYYLRKILIAAYCLDRLGVFKDEFQRPFTNILINGRKVYLLDFERGLLNKPWKNVPQFLQFLVALKVLNKEEAIRLGREYKKYPKEVVKKLLKRLKSFQNR